MAMMQTQLECVLHDADLFPFEVECSEIILDFNIPPQTPPSHCDEEELRSPNQSEKWSREEAVKISDTNSNEDQQRGKHNFERQKDPTTYVNRKNKKQNGNQKVRVYRKYYCLYCGKPTTEIARHLQYQHMELRDVAYAFSFPLGSKQRRVLLGQLRNLGDFKHNAKVLAKGRGDLVTWLQSSDMATVKDYMPGSFCSDIFAGVSAENPYLCGRPGVRTNIRDCLRKCIEESKAKMPELLRSAKLRKHVTSLCKLLDLYEQELEQAARFMGHCTLQKISTPPSGTSSGMEQDMATSSGRNLDPLDLSAYGKGPVLICESVQQRKRKYGEEMDEDGGSDLSSTSKNGNSLSDDGGSELSSPERRHEPCNDDESSDLDDQRPGTHLVNRTSQKTRKEKRGKQTKTVEATDGGSELSSELDVDAIDQTPGTRQKPSQKKKRGKPKKPVLKGRRPWSDAERSAVHRHLANFMAELRVPRKEACIQCLKKESVLDGRSWKDIKYFVYNTIVTLNCRSAREKLAL